jgi:hypothetical protein
MRARGLPLVEHFVKKIFAAVICQHGAEKVSFYSSWPICGTGQARFKPAALAAGRFIFVREPPDSGKFR